MPMAVKEEGIPHADTQIWEASVSAGQRGQRAGRGVSVHRDDDMGPQGAQPSEQHAVLATVQ